jgi:hypothetical protein
MSFKPVGLSVVGLRHKAFKSKEKVDKEKEKDMCWIAA